MNPRKEKAKIFIRSQWDIPIMALFETKFRFSEVLSNFRIHLYIFKIVSNASQIAVVYMISKFTFPNYPKTFSNVFQNMFFITLNSF